MRTTIDTGHTCPSCRSASIALGQGSGNKLRMVMWCYRGHVYIIDSIRATSKVVYDFAHGAERSPSILPNLREAKGK